MHRTHTHTLTLSPLPHHQKLHIERRSDLADYLNRSDHKSPLWAVLKCSRSSPKARLDFQDFVSTFARLVRGAKFVSCGVMQRCARHDEGADRLSHRH
jgi:hypothetical protein